MTRSTSSTNSSSVSLSLSLVSESTAGRAVVASGGAVAAACDAVVAAAASIYVAYEIYKKNGLVPNEKENAKQKWKTTIYNKFYIDEIYDSLIRKPIDYLSGVFHKIFDIQIFDGIVNGVGTFAKTAGSYVRLIQNGSITFYFISMVIAVAVILIFTFLI